MKKTLLLSFLSCLVLLNGYSQDKEKTKPLFKLPDTVNVAIVKGSGTQKTAMLDSAALVQILKSNNNSAGWQEPELVNTAIQIIAILAAIIAGWVAWHTFRRDKSYRDQSFLIDYNKLMIEHPELRAYKTIYKNDFKFSIELNGNATLETFNEELILAKGKHSFTVTAPGSTFNCANNEDAQYTIPKNATITMASAGTLCLQSVSDKELLTKVKAYCHYKLNYFELVFNLSGGKEKNIKAWENYFKHLYNESEVFKRIVSEAIGADAAIYSENFVTRIKKILNN